jgi:site-specific DNA-methyltransferase (adenine-specific)
MSWEIRQGDALERLREMPDNSVDMVFTDPPYGHNNNNNGDLISKWEAALGRGDYRPENNRPIANDGPEANDLLRSVLPEIRRVLVPGGCCCCCCGGGGPDPQFARWSLWIDEVLDFKQMVVWDKGPMGMGWHYRRSYEVVLVAQKPGAPCKWYDTSNRVENIIRYTKQTRKIIPSSTHHPTPKPENLAAHFIRLHSQPGETVLDPFCGGGSTVAAAHLLGRHGIGIELAPEYVEMARRRLEDDMPLFAREVAV